MHGARRPLVSKPGTSVTSATPATCRASLALSSQRAFKGPGGGEKATPRKRTLREASLLGRPHPPVVRAATVETRHPAAASFRSCYIDAPAIDPARSLSARRRVYRIPPFPAASETSGNSGLSFLFAGKSDKWWANRRLRADPPSPRDVPNVSQTCHADATPRGLAESQRRVRAGLTRRREPPRRVSRGRRGARKGIRESDAWLIATRAPS